MSTSPDELELTYLVDRTWFEREVLAGRDAKRVHAIRFQLDDLDEGFAERALAIGDSIVTDQPGRIEVHGTGINPRAEDPNADEVSPTRQETMDGPIISRIGWLPELPAPTADPEAVIVAWEDWLDAYRDASLDALRQWAERWHPGDAEGESRANETWWRVTLPYRIVDGEGDRVRSITFDGLRDLELFQRVRSAKSRLDQAGRLTILDDGIVADQALGSEFVVDNETFFVGAKPESREALVDAFEVFAERWRTVALAAKENRLRRKGAFDRGMREWANEHGSERLRLGLEDGYRMTAVYLEERLGSEFPGFYAWSERNPDAYWNPRVGPTETALIGRRQVQESLNSSGSNLQAEIVWMTDPPKEMREPWWGADWVDDDDVGPCEVIIVRGWLDRYTLVGPVSSEEAPIPKGYAWEPVFGSRPVPVPVDNSDFQPGGGEDDIPF